jgi:hypothetical protein
MPALILISFQHYFKDGVVLRSDLQISNFVGAGGFAQLYKARDLINGVDVAIKAEPSNSRDAERLILEQRALLRLAGTSHVPELVCTIVSVSVDVTDEHHFS